MNMIFIGDFTQLPPVGGENVSLYSHTAGLNRTTLLGYYAAIGKALWHQVTTVVILQKNMRNQGESVHDVMFRRALKNMHYKACTPEDVRFLKSLVSCNKPGHHYIGLAPWRDAPIIVGENCQKDEINRLGCLQYAADSSQSLTKFYSVDSMANISEDGHEKLSLK